MSADHTEAPRPKPRQTRRDVSWAVLFRLAHTGVWSEWSNGHRTQEEAIGYADPLRALDAVAQIRIDRITHQRDMFSIDDLTTEGSDTP